MHIATSCFGKTAWPPGAMTSFPSAEGNGRAGWGWGGFCWTEWLCCFVLTRLAVSRDQGRGHQLFQAYRHPKACSPSSWPTEQAGQPMVAPSAWNSPIVRRANGPPNYRHRAFEIPSLPSLRVWILWPCLGSHFLDRPPLPRELANSLPFTNELKVPLASTQKLDLSLALSS